MSTLNADSIRSRGGGKVSLPDGVNVGSISSFTDQISIKSEDSTPGRVDIYCEVNNLHYARLQAPAHAEFSGNPTATLPTVSGDLVVGNTSSAISLDINTTGIITSANGALSGPPQVTGIASGTIPANRAVCVHNDGKVGVVTGTKITWGAFAELGTSPPNLQGNGTTIDIAFGDGKVFVVSRFYNATSGNHAGSCIVGTPNADNSSVSWGSWTQFETTIDGYCRVVYDSNANKFVIAYNRSSTIKSRVATVSGTSITYGTETEVIAANAESIEGIFDPDSNQVIWAYKTGSNIAYSRKGAISGTSISYGTQAQIAANNSNGPVGITYDTKNNKVIVAVGYNGDQSNKGWAFIGDGSGTAYPGNVLASAGEINYNYQYSRINLLYDEERERYVFVSYNGNNSQWESLVGKYVSATSITWGDPNLIEKYSSGTGSYNSMSYDPYRKVYILLHNSPGDLVMYATGEINPVGSTEPENMVWSQKQIYKGNYNSMATATLENSLIMAYGGTSTFNAYYRVTGFRNSTLSGDGSNFIGYSAAAYTNGQTAAIDVVGGTSTQVGLSVGLKHYIQGDGGLVDFIDPNFPSSSYKEAGVAVSATKLLIK